MGFSRQEYWSGLPCPFPGDLPDWEIEPASLMSPALAGRSLPLVPTGKSCRVLKFLKGFFLTWLAYTTLYSYASKSFCEAMKMGERGRIGWEDNLKVKWIAYVTSLMLKEGMREKREYIQNLINSFIY